MIILNRFVVYANNSSSSPNKDSAACALSPPNRPDNDPSSTQSQPQNDNDDSDTEEESEDHSSPSLSVVCQKSSTGRSRVVVQIPSDGLSGVAGKAKKSSGGVSHLKPMFVNPH